MYLIFDPEILGWGDVLVITEILSLWATVDIDLVKEALVAVALRSH